MKSRLLIFFAILISITLFAQPYPIRSIGDKKYYVYTVEVGEGLFAVGRKFGVSQAELHACNPDLGEGLKAGQTLLVPFTAASTSMTQPSSSSKNYLEHTVTANQTLYAISKIYGVTIEDIIALNPSAADKIYVGQVLKIPVANPKQDIPVEKNTVVKKKIIEHEVKRKESLYSISKLYKISINELIEANPSLADGVRKGDILKVPVDDDNTTQPASSQPTPQVEEKQTTSPVLARTHTVKEGETLYSISRLYNLTASDLLALNPEAKDAIKVGQMLKIPAQTTENKTSIEQKKSTSDTIIKHKVQPRETIFSISQKYKVDINDLIAANPDAESGIKEGEELIIPSGKQRSEATIQPTKPNESTSVSSSTTHKVERGETLYSISRQYGISVNELIAANPENQQGIKKGDVLQIPIAKVVFEVEPINASHIRVVLLLPFMTNIANMDGSADRFVDFYKGALIALNDIKKTGLSIDLHTYDIGKDTKALDTLLTKEALLKADLIVGPVFREQVGMISDFSRKHQIYTIIPFTSNVESKYLHDHVLQFNPPQDIFYKTLAEHIVKKYSKQNFIIAYFPEQDAKGTSLANALKIALNNNNQSYKEVSITPDNVDTLYQMVGKNKSFLLLASSSLTDINPILPRINNLDLSNCVIWGFEDWGKLVENAPNLYYYSLFYPQPSVTYELTYERWFGSKTAVPNPYYDLIGYDILYYFCSNMLRKDGKIVIRLPQDIKLLQSQFNFAQQPSGGFINTSYFIMHWNGQMLEEPEYYK